ncbi:Uma2 family endonuclease [Streptomyces tubbatahanensis]|uniref:Uma2 family endonuclease n=1 Tax=Streptomyces tubbatahanensis TaxID=2923272 RepID=A0ABY3XX08_9ACTN|nr:Uma2 family endonuclease [Streptomyces tubbatahanensis]UNS98900.1 Uma2 family endonuclease [Streptomyces tubbatahanensis]
MTVMAEREAQPRVEQMQVEEFEAIASSSPETVTLEFLDGRIGVKKVPDGNHDEIIQWLQERCMQHRPDVWLYGERGLVVEAYRKGRARPDGVLAPKRHFIGHGEWSDADGVLMTVEVTSYDRDTDSRDRTEKPTAYASVGIPVYLLIDRDSCTVTVHSGPEEGRYRDTHTVSFGERVELPDPVGLALETDAFKEFVR